jgi:hypothetical protein
VSFAAITLCVASQRVFIVVSIYFVMSQSGNFWTHPRMTKIAGDFETHALCSLQSFCRIYVTADFVSAF